MLILAHSSERRGYLQLNGKPMPDSFIANKCGTDVSRYLSLLSELENAAVPSRTPEGTIYSRRMVRDERKRAADRDRQAKHRGRDVTRDVTPYVTPLSVNDNVTEAVVVDLENKTAEIKEEIPISFRVEPPTDGDKWVKRFRDSWPKPGGAEVLAAAHDAMQREVEEYGKRYIEAGEFIAKNLLRCKEFWKHWPRSEKCKIPNLYDVLSKRMYAWDDELWERSDGGSDVQSRPQKQSALDRYRESRSTGDGDPVTPIS